MAKKKQEEAEIRHNGQVAATLNDVPAERWLRDEYFPYADYVIRHRALVAGDGLKPVQRRLLWSMFEKNVTPNGRHLKAARCAADAVAYHPHADSSASDALARMAQNFSLRVPLIDPHGSVGFVYGDRPAAPRYWEARLSPAGMELVKEARYAAEMIPNYDSTLEEPRYLPVRFPNEIINGTQGIAVGFASNMPSHNPDEVMAAAKAMLKKPGMSADDLLKIMPGPDLPTGGEILGTDGIKEYYETGRGSFTMRARCSIETLPRGAVKFVFNELPYGSTIEDIISQIKLLRTTRKVKKMGKMVEEKPNEILLNGISEMTDLTDRKNGLKFVVKTRPGYNHNLVLAELYKTTKLQAVFSVNAVVLIEGAPIQTSILEMLKNFLDFRRVAISRRLERRLEHVVKRVNQLDGVLKVMVDLDEAIKTIRASDTPETAAKKLMRKFKLNDEQAQYILSLSLRKLTKQDSNEINAETKSLHEEHKEILDTLAKPELMNSVIARELDETLKVISDPRRSIIKDMTGAELVAAEKEAIKQAVAADSDRPVFVSRFADGTLLKSDEAFAYGDKLRKFANTPLVEQLSMNSADPLVVVTSDGIGHRIPLSFLPDNNEVAPSKLGIKLAAGVDIVGIALNEAKPSGGGLALGTSGGLVKVANTDFPTRSDEFPVISLNGDDKVVGARWMNGSDGFFTFVSSGGNILAFDASLVAPKGSKAGGMAGMKLKAGDKVIFFGWVKDMKGAEDAAVVTVSNKTIKRTQLSEIPTKGRGGQGVATQVFKTGENVLVTAYVGTESIIASATSGKQKVQLPPLAKRSARGVDFDIPVRLGQAEIVAK